MAKMVWKTDNQLLEEAKIDKKSDLSSACQEDILGGFDHKIDGKEYRFSYDREAQTNLQERFSLFENNLIESIPMTVSKNNEHLRIVVDKDQFMSIYLSSVLAKENKISKLRDILYPMVDSALTKEELEEIEWGMDIPNEADPTVILDDSETLGKQVSEVKEQSKRTQQSLSMANSGLLELTLLTMMEGN